MNKPPYEVTVEEVQKACKSLLAQLPDNPLICGVPRGGIYALGHLRRAAEDSGKVVTMTLFEDKRGYILDDLVDSGRTRRMYAGFKFCVLFDKSQEPHDWLVGTRLPPDTGWLLFPWEDRDESLGSARTRGW